MSPSVSSHERCSRDLIFFVALCCTFQHLHICLVLGTSTPHCCFTSPEKMVSITSLSVLITLLTVQPWILFASLWQGHIDWLLVSFAFSRTHRSFSLAQGVVAPSVRDLAFSLVNLMRFPSTRLPSLSGSVWVVAQPLAASAASLCILPSASLAHRLYLA